MKDSLNRNAGANITIDQSKTWNNNHVLSIALFEVLPPSLKIHAFSQAQSSVLKNPWNLPTSSKISNPTCFTAVLEMLQEQLRRCSVCD
jgi:hypothetical protein